MIFKTIVLLLSILPAVLLQKTCSISMISRRSCQMYPVITDETACKNVGCCFDSSPRTPKSGRCYKQGRVLHLGHFGSFNPTAAPPSSGFGRGNQYRVMGGSPGHQGSVVTVKCDQSNLCRWSNQYLQDRRSDCVRQGCCWRSGQCWANVYTIITLRSTCEPGFKNPPKCEEHYPCQVTPHPCKNGGTCADVRPGNFKCTCLTGFSGVTCNANCQRSQLNTAKGKVIPEAQHYIEGQHVTLACVAGATYQAGAKTARQCLNGQFAPTLSKFPFTCSSDCSVEAVSKAKASTTAATVIHGVDVTYTCDAGTTSASTNVLTRKCTDGKLMPHLTTTAIVCDSDCAVETVANAGADKTTLKHGESVTYSCSATFSSTAGQTLTRKCVNGALSPSLSTDKIVCSSDCTITAPAFATVTSTTAATVKHGTTVAFSCQSSHAGVAPQTTKRLCINGKLSPDFVTTPYVCSENCKITQIANAGTMAAILLHGYAIDLKCLSTHTSLAVAVSKRTCAGGKLVPDLASKPFTCYKTCTVDAVADATSAPTKGSPLVHLAQVTYACAATHNHPVVGTQLIRTCKDGNLDPPLASKAITCSAQCKQIALGVKLQSSVGNNVVVQHGTIVYYRCNPNKYSSPAAAVLTRVCTDGTFLPDFKTAPLECNPHCTAPENLAYGSYAPHQLSYTTGHPIIYKCETKFTHSATGVTKRTCGKSGVFEPTFAASPLVCSSDCISPTAVPGAHVVTSQPIRNGKPVVYACDTDYVQDPTSKMTKTCVTGSVVPNPIVLGSAIKCYKPCTFTVPTGAKATSAAPYKHGIKVTLACNTGWTSPAGAIHTRSCVDGTVSPALVAAPYVCNKGCGAPTTVAGATFIPALSVKANHGEKVKYSCIGDATTADELERVCTNGEYLPTIAKQGITCHPSCMPEILVGGTYLPKFMSGVKHAHNQHITYSCDSGKTHPSAAQTKRTCTDGVFRPTFAQSALVCSADCAINGVVGNSGHNQGAKSHIKHGEAVTYTCKGGFSQPGYLTSVQTCDNGVLKTSHAFVCYADCTPPTAIANGAFSGTSVKHDGIILFACDVKSYSSLSSAVLKRTCKNGKYEPDFKTAPLQCYKNCVPESPTNGDHTPKSPKYAHNSEITYQCNNKFSPSTNNALKRTCTDGFFLPKLANNPISCLEDCEVLQRHKATTSPSLAIIKSGAVVMYTCEKGWSPGVGGTPMKRTCAAGKLHPEMAALTDVVCYKNCAKPAAKAQQTIAPATSDSFYKHKTTLTYSCSPKHTLTRGAKNTKTCENGNLVDTTDLVCYKDCPSFTKPSNAQVVVKFTPQIEGDTAALSCDAKFSHPSTAKTILTCTGGAWSVASNFVCNADCAALPVVTDSVIMPTQATYKHGDAIVISCVAEHTLLEAAGVSRVCTNGNYVPSLITKPATCKKMCTVELINNGITSNSKAIALSVKTKVTYGITVTLSCNTGWSSLAGARSSRKCGENGAWEPTLTSNAFTCHKDCTVTAPTDGSIKGGKTTATHLMAVEFLCNLQHTMVGIASRTCQDGNLSPAGAVKCHKKCQVQTVKGGVSTSALGTWIEHMSSETFKCSNLYTTTHTLTRKCVDGKFVPAVDDKNDPLKCYQGCTPANYQNMIAAPATIPQNAVHTYVCVSTHSMDPTSQATRTCVDGKLSPLPATNTPKCWLKCTTAFPVIPHATTTPTSAPLNHGATVVYACGVNYDAHQNQINLLTRKCVNGKLDPPIDNTNPIACYLNCDVKVISNANTNVKTTKIKSGEKVIYTCKNTHSPSLPSTVLTRTCSDGILYPKFPTNLLECKQKCDASQAVTPHATAASALANHGDNVVYTCAPNYKTTTFSKTFVAICDAGKMTNLMTCHIACQVEKLDNGAAIGAAVGGYIDHGAKVVYKCAKDYSTTDTLERTCQNGKWAPEINAITPLKCYKVCKTITAITQANPTPQAGPVNHKVVVTYKCRSQYNFLSGDPTTTTCADGNFVTTGIKCHQQCQVPSTTHLKTPVSSSYSDHAPSTSVQFACDVHHMAKTNQILSRKCSEGKWNPTFSSAILTCEPMCKVPNIAKSTAVPAIGEWVQNGKTFTFTCEKEHHTTDKTTRSCNLGTWTPPIASSLKCYKECTVVIGIKASPTATMPTVGNKVNHNTVIKYACSTGYSTTYTLSRTCNDGEWTPSMTTGNDPMTCYKICTVEDLTAYNAISKVSGTSQTLTANSKQNHKVVINLECTVKSTIPLVPRITSGIANRECIDGNWNPPIGSSFSCHAQCTVAIGIKASPTATMPTVGNKVNHNTVIKYACSTGYSTTYTLSRTCNDGEWTPSMTTGNDPMTCYQKCDAATLTNVLNADASPKTGLVNHKDSVTFTCKSNFNTESGTAMTVMCSDSNWMSHSYTNDCKSKCEKPNIVQLKEPSAQLTRHHSTNEVTFECNSGYAQKTGQTAIRKCNNAVWDPSLINSAFECAQSCMVSYQLIGGKSVPAKNAYVKFGGLVAYSCGVGYSPSTTGTGLTRTCGTSGNFDGVVMDITTLKCFKDCLAKSFTGATGDKKVIHGGTVDYTCLAGYEQDGTTLQATCNDGLLSTVKCKAKCKVAAVPNGNVKPDVDSFVAAAGTVVYTCKSGFVDSGDLTLTCTDSAWAPTLQAAKTKCNAQCTLELVDGTVAKIGGAPATAGLKNHLTKVDYECVTTTHTEKSGKTTSESYCIDGEWKHGTLASKIFTENKALVFIKCEKKCQMSSFAGTGTAVTPDTATINTGAEATYTCTLATANFLIDGKVLDEVKRTCNDGTIDIKGLKCDNKCKLPTVPSLVKSAGYIDHNPTFDYVLACVTDYIIDPATTVRCDAGVLAPPISASVSCKQGCTFDSTKFVASGGSSPHDTKKTHGEKITFKCKSGYSSPHVLERTCTAGSFAPAVTTTDPLCYTDCAIPSIANLAKPSTTSPNSADNDVEFACETGFHHGTSTMKYKCNKGIWLTAPTIDCKKMCQVVDVAHATESSAAGSYVKENDSVTYACINSYTSSGTMTLTCTNSAWVPTLQAAKTQCIKPCTIPAVVGATSTPASGNINDAVKVVYACKATHSERNGATMTSTCTSGTLDVTGVQCDLSCVNTVVHGVPTQGAYTIHGTTISYACKTDSNKISGTVSRRCDKGLWTPSFNSNPFICKKKCNPVKKSGTKTPLTTIDSGAKVTYECETGHTLAPGKVLEYTCTDGALVPDVSTLKCNKNDPDIDIFFAYNNHKMIDDCQAIKTNKVKNWPYSISALVQMGFAQAKFIKQIAWMYAFETEYVTVASTKTRMGIYSNDGTSCGAAKVQRSLTSAATTTTLLASGIIEYQCTAKQLDDVLACVHQFGFQTSVSGKKKYLVYYASVNTNSVAVYNQFAAANLDLKDIFIFVVETRPTTDSGYQASKTLFDSILDDSVPVESGKLFGKFVGSTATNPNMALMRTYLK